MKFRKKPVTIDAIQYTGDNPSAVCVWAASFGEAGFFDVAKDHLTIPTLEGDHRADIGDWIIRGVKGEFYPCKPDIFAMTYEPVEG